MGRYGFIPPHRRPAPSYYRPATVAEVLDAGGPDEGYHYRVLYAGQSLEMFTCPGSKLLSVGNLVIPRVVHGSQELFLPMPMGEAEIIYLTPGGAWADTGWPRGELWKYTGAGTPTYVWTCPQDKEYITGLCYCLKTKKLLIFTFRRATTFREYCRIYECDLSTDNVSLVIDDYQLWPDYKESEPATEAAEWGDYVYISHAGWAATAGLMRLDPTDYSYEWVQTQDYADYSQGGIAVSDDETYLYWFDTHYVWASTTGKTGSFTSIFDLWSHTPEGWDASGMVLNKGDGCVYFSGGLHAHEEGIWHTTLYRIEATTVYEEVEFTDSDAGNASQISQVAPLYNGNSVERLFAGRWGWYGSDEVRIWREDDSWQTDHTFSDYACLTPNQTLLSFRDKMHVLLSTWDADTDEYTQKLIRRDGPGSYTEIYAWTDYESEAVYQHCFAMTLVNTTKKVHEL